MSFQDLVPPRGWRRSSSVNAGLALASLAAGAAAVALLEPRSGSLRRGLVAQKAVHAGRAARAFGEKAARDLANRSRGVLASARSSIREPPAPDEVVCERVRSALGRLTSHPSAIEVVARGGVVELRGAVLEAEVEQVLSGTWQVRGVHEVLDRLDRHAQPGSVPGLRGGEPLPGSVPELMRQRWSPATRLLVILFGATLVVRGLRPRGPRGPTALAMTTLGALLTLRAVTNVPARRLLPIGARRRGELRRAVGVEAARDEARPT